MRVKNLFLINTIFLYIVIYFNTFIDALKISLLTLYYIYNLTRIIIKILAIIYINLNEKLRINNLIDLLI